jgi:hypothetical protein
MVTPTEDEPTVSPVMVGAAEIEREPANAGASYRRRQ